MRTLVLRTLVLLLAPVLVSGQGPQPPSAVKLYNDLQELNFLGSALYIAAHPDDENTRLISYLSNAVHARTAYLSMTRGDGGQNLIGTELRELLGVLRTQELLAAALAGRSLHHGTAGSVDPSQSHPGIPQRPLPFQEFNVPS